MRSPRTASPTGRRLIAGATGSALVLAAAVVGAVAAPAPAARAAGDPAAECAAAVVSAMTLEQQVGQLFVAGENAGGPTAAQAALVADRHLGGVILTGRSNAGTAATRRVTDDLRNRSGGAVTGGVGLWVSTDQEGGAVQVLSGPGFSTIPTALAQGRLDPGDLRGRAAGWGRELAAAGVDLDLAPVLDTVPADLGTRNRPIGYYAREYANDPGGVSRSGGAFAAGLADAGVQATGKHFPGLGRVLDNTDTTAGVTDGTTVRGDAYLAPFADAVRSGIPVVMVSSATYSRIDASTIATFSPVVINDMLRGDLGFTGVVMTDSLGAVALSGVPVADRAVRFIAAGGTVALSAESDIVGPMIDGVLARARSDAGFRGQVQAAARTVVDTKFDAGLVTCPTAAGAIAEHQVQLGGDSGWLGPATGAVTPVAGGAQQDYRNGTVYWSPSTGAWAVRGAIRDHYRALGGPAGELGFPVTDELPTPDGIGALNHFAGSGGASIYWSPATGAHEVQGAIRDRWAATGWEKGPLGYPVTDELPTPDGIGAYNHFAGSGGGSIYWSPATGAHEVQGDIRAHWAALGWEGGPLGYPVTDELPTPDGIGALNHFSKGASIYWSPATGAHEVHGAIRDHYAALGWEKSDLGYPVTDELDTPDGIGAFNHFAGSGGGSIYWSPATGAHEIQGDIRARWAALGWEGGLLGYPVTDELPTPDGKGAFNHFSRRDGASVYWSRATGAHEVHGPIRDRWAAQGWEKGPLGYPLTDQYALPGGGGRNDFQGGSLTTP
ncbi:hypothetical protein KUM42_08450 [Modestobacter sp. L9-4]|uniref:glycoside hydrolase family 3 N-terminal domain-containing protein n=1 Tax=Modestobacter sp. L9-4 TaxID=2851567 RepID=UPI001C77D9B6|nr:glycoside hydrolase family 3 N-terminal domain-containing protein [Modestobacter sp. L9-4]QXG77515.1 hypothetical protein KUM42_08450 [Modestobacter sp. L9-4]